MFDSLVDATSGLSGAGAVCAWTRVESAACARRVFGMVDVLDAAYAADPYGSRDQWCLDNWGAVTAHLGAALSVTSGTVSKFLIVGTVLRQRFPRTAAMFLAGEITYAMVSAIVTRTNLAIDDAVFTELDALLAEQILGWGPMSVDKTEKTIDALLEGLDPQAVHRTQAKARNRGVDLRRNTGSGIAELFITLFAHDGEAFYQKVTAMAATVCPADPRGVDQRRADATGALALGADRLACLCGTKDCPAPDLPPASSVVVYVIARQDTITDPPTPTPPPDVPTPSPDASESEATQAEADAAPRDVADADADESAQPSSEDGPGEDSEGPAEEDAEDEVDANADQPAADLTPTTDESGETNRDHDHTVREELRPNHTPAANIIDPAIDDSGDQTETPTIDRTTECAGVAPTREMTLAQVLAQEPGMTGALLPGAVSRRAAMNATLMPHPQRGPPAITAAR